VLDQNGREVVVGHRLAGGGEGSVYLLPTRPKDVVKIYHEVPNETLVRKLRWMVKNPPKIPSTNAGSVVAWPKSLVRDVDTRKTIGFIMPKVAHQFQFTHILDPELRKDHRTQSGFVFEDQQLLKIAYELVRLVDRLHIAGYVIGDMNGANIRINGMGGIAIIDSDSFQVTEIRNSSPFIHHCGVGVAEFLPPELIHQNFATTTREATTDLHSLAVLLFKLFMGNTHPFLVDAAGGAVRDPLDNVEAGIYPYDVDRRIESLRPHPVSPVFGRLHPDVRSLFQRAFSVGLGTPAVRPKPSEWTVALDRARKASKKCARDHWYDASSPNRVCLFRSKSSVCGSTQHEQSRPIRLDAIDVLTGSAKGEPSTTVRPITTLRPVMTSHQQRAAVRPRMATSRPTTTTSGPVRPSTTKPRPTTPRPTITTPVPIRMPPPRTTPPPGRTSWTPTVPIDQSGKLAPSKLSRWAWWRRIFSRVVAIALIIFFVFLIAAALDESGDNSDVDGVSTSTEVGADSLSEPGDPRDWTFDSVLDMAGGGLMFSAREGEKWSLRVWNPDSNRQIRLLDALAANPLPIISTAKRTFVFVYDTGSSRHLVIVKGASNPRMIELSRSNSVLFMSLDPDGRNLMVSRLYVDGLKVERFSVGAGAKTTLLTGARDLTFGGPDLTAYVVPDYGSLDLVIGDAVGKARRGVIGTEGDDSLPRFSSSGEYLAFDVAGGDGSHAMSIYVLNERRYVEVRLPSGEESQTPTWPMWDIEFDTFHLSTCDTDGCTIYEGSMADGTVAVVARTYAVVAEAEEISALAWVA
jgi:serine/threonine protein kinase